MPLYSYKARDQHGSVSQDTIQAANRIDAAAIVKARGLQVLVIKDIDSALSKMRGGVSISEKSAFCRFTATMLRSGLSLHEAAEIIKQESENDKMKMILSDISFSVGRGQPLSLTLAKYKEVFDPVFLTLVKAGEESGTLEQSFDYLADQLQASYEFSQKIKGSLMYPIVVIGAMFGIGMVMLVFVLPRISEVFLRMNINLPFLTKIILKFGLFVGQHIPFVIAAIVVLVIMAGFTFYLKSTRMAMLYFLTRVPTFRRLVNQIDVARFARTLSTLLRSGVPIISALEVAADSLNQPQLRSQAMLFTKGVEKGRSLSEVLGESKQGFPPVMVQTIRTGEKTGSLEKVLQDLAVFYEKEVDFQLKQVTALIEPVLMLTIGIIVGAMVIMIVAPIYSIIGNLQDTMKK